MTLNSGTPLSTLGDPVDDQAQEAPASRPPAYAVGDLSAAEVARTLRIAHAIGIDFERAGFSVAEFGLGIRVEEENSRLTHLTDIVGDDPQVAGMLALTHLRVRSDYYTQLTTPHSPGDAPITDVAHEEVGAD